MALNTTQFVEAIRERVFRPGLGSIDYTLARDLIDLFAEFDGDPALRLTQVQREKAEYDRILRGHDAESQRLRAIFDERHAKAIEALSGAAVPAGSG